MSESALTMHATTVAIRGKAILLTGPSGCGKSDLALRLIDAGARLVADDQTVLKVRSGSVFASAPRQLAGRIEVRGLGIVKMDASGDVPVHLAVSLDPASVIERLPEPDFLDVLDVRLPRITVSSFEASAVAKLKLALRHYTEG